MNNTTMYKETPLALADRLSRLEDAVQLAVTVDEFATCSRIFLFNQEMEIGYTVYPPTEDNRVYTLEAQVAIFPSVGKSQLGTCEFYHQVIGKIMGHFFETYTEAKDTGQLDR
jgi:hypothetical protein